MTELTRLDCADWLLSRDHFVILTHRKPDGDTIGSAAGLCRGLRSLGKTAHILENPEVTPLYAPLAEGLTKPEPEEGDILIAVDVAADTMLPRVYDHLKNSIDLRIDHHGSGREYTPAEHVDSESAACAEIIWELLLDMEVEPDEKMAEAIYVGVSTDTGCFRFANTTAHTFDVAGDCAAAVRMYIAGIRSCLIQNLCPNCGCRAGSSTMWNFWLRESWRFAVFPRKWKRISAWTRTI